MSDIRIPLKLNKCPLVDALIEIRFKSDLDKSVIFGCIYSLIRESYPGPVVNLPITQIPSQIRDNDPQLQFKPLYRIDGNDTILQIGTDVICISSKNPYIGWDVMSRRVLDVINKIRQGGIIKNVVRLGHRYVNFFDGIIDEKLNMTLKLVNHYNISNSLIRFEISEGEYVSTLQYSNSAAYKPNPSLIERKGSVIDIDTFRIYSGDYFLQNIETEINTAHLIEKELFYSLLKEDFIKELEPVY